jgi:acetyl-CoA acetyltransferase
MPSAAIVSAARTINKVRDSVLKAVALPAQSIVAGDAEVVAAGGQENMSLAPHVLPGSRSASALTGRASRTVRPAEPAPAWRVEAQARVARGARALSPHCEMALRRAGS